MITLPQKNKKILRMKNDKEHDFVMMLLFAIIISMRDCGDNVTETLHQAIVEYASRKQSMDSMSSIEIQHDSSEYCYGIRGLADYLGVSAPTAQKYVNSGLLDSAIRKVGRKYSFLKAKVDEAFKKQ